MMASEISPSLTFTRLGLGQEPHWGLRFLDIAWGFLLGSSFNLLYAHFISLIYLCFASVFLIGCLCMIDRVIILSVNLIPILMKGFLCVFARTQHRPDTAWVTNLWSFENGGSKMVSHFPWIWITWTELWVICLKPAMADCWYLAYFRHFDGENLAKVWRI